MFFVLYGTFNVPLPISNNGSALLIIEKKAQLTVKSIKMLHSAKLTSAAFYFSL